MIAVFVALLTFVSTLFGGFLALRLKDRLHLVLAFASGAVIATALFELFPEVVELSALKGIPLTNLLLFTAGGFLLFHILERVIVFQSCHDHDCEEEGHQHVGILSASGFSLHSMFDGLGIGLGFLTNFQLGLLISFAVLAHDFSDGLNTATVIMRNKGNRRQAIKWILIDAAAPLVGVGASFIFSSAVVYLPYIFAFYAGFFLYLGASDLLPEAHHRHSSYFTILATVLGFTMVYLLSGALHS